MARLPFLSSYELLYSFLLYLFLEPVETLQRWLFLLPPWHWHGWEFLYPLPAASTRSSELAKQLPTLFILPAKKSGFLWMEMK